MVWTVGWVVLVLGGLACLGWLGRSLWRRTHVLLAEVHAAADRLSGLTAAAERRTAQRVGPPITSTVLADPEPLARRVAALRRQRAGRRQDRRARHARTYAAWRALTR